MGQQLTITDQSGTTTNTYDVLGRVSSEVNGRGNRLAYEYDKAGRRVAMVDPESGRTTYSYADNGWLTKLTDPQNGVTNYAYDKLGRELTKTLPNGVKSSHVYNAVGEETLLEERDASNTLLSSYASTYNNVGMKLTVTERDGSVMSYRYYPDNSLSREERVGSGAYVREYFYDAAGNLLRRVRDGLENVSVLDKANQIVSKTGPSGMVNFFYDADGNLSRQSNPDGSGQSYFFDGRDQLSAVEIKSAGGALSHRSEFLYDGFGRLVKSREFVRQNNAWVKQSERGRVFDGLDTVQERGGANQVLGQLTRDGNIGGILSRKAGAVTSFFGYDGNGNVTLLSDAQGNSVGSYRYDGFGNALEVSGSAANQNSHRFSTKELHAPSGLYYYGFRFYSPALGRWISRDPIGEAGGVNLYQVVRNNPVNLVDFYGEDPLLKSGLHPDASDALRRVGFGKGGKYYGRIGQTLGYASDSAGTHGKAGVANGKAYGSCVDIRTNGLSDKEIKNVLEELGHEGFAAWYRDPGKDSWPSDKAVHVHAVYAGAPTKNSIVNRQLSDFLVGKTGLKGHKKYNFYAPSDDSIKQVRALMGGYKESKDKAPEKEKEKLGSIWDVLQKLK